MKFRGGGGTKYSQRKTLGEAGRSKRKQRKEETEATTEASSASGRSCKRRIEVRSDRGSASEAGGTDRRWQEDQASTSTRDGQNIEQLATETGNKGGKDKGKGKRH